MYTNTHSDADLLHVGFSACTIPLPHSLCLIHSASFPLPHSLFLHFLRPSVFDILYKLTKYLRKLAEVSRGINLHEEVHEGRLILLEAILVIDRGKDPRVQLHTHLHTWQYA